MKTFQNCMVKNRKSPKNEQQLIDAYKSINPNANRKDGKDVSAVVNRDGVLGHALLSQGKNRSKDLKEHRGQDFISDKELKKKMVNKKK